MSSSVAGSESECEPRSLLHYESNITHSERLSVINTFDGFWCGGNSCTVNSINMHPNEKTSVVSCRPTFGAA